MLYTQLHQRHFNMDPHKPFHFPSYTYGYTEEKNGHCFFFLFSFNMVFKKIFKLLRYANTSYYTTQKGRLGDSSFSFKFIAMIPPKQYLLFHFHS